MSSNYQQKKMMNARGAIDTKGNIVLEQFQDGTALLFQPGNAQPFCVATDYDRATASWSYGKYFSDLGCAHEAADPEIIEDASVRWVKEDIREKLKAQDIAPTEFNVQSVIMGDSRLWERPLDREFRDNMIASGNDDLDARVTILKENGNFKNVDTAIPVTSLEELEQYRSDRLTDKVTREMELVEKYIHGLFPIWGIRFVGMVDGADTSVKGNKKARQINGLVNEWYLEDMSENIKSSLDDLRRKGHHIGAWVRYGYMKDPNQKGHIIPDPVAAAVVERIFKMYLEGNSRADIARILNSEQIPPPGLYKIQQGDKYKNAFMAGEWDSCSISRILKEEMYIGNMVQGRQASESYKTKKLRTLPKEDWIRVIGTHEAIISLETWNQTQALLAVGARSFTRSEEIGLFSRKVYCGHCNKLMRTGRSKRKSGTYYNYVICVRRHPEINPCPVHAVSNALMEKTILDQLDILAAKYKDGSLFSEIMDEESTIGIEIKRLKAELAQHKKKLVEYESGLKCLYLDKASGSISNSDYQFLSRELSAGKELAERKVDLCTENYNKILRSQEILREKAGVLESYSRPKELTRSMVETFIDHIVICSSSDGTSKQEIKIYWNF